MMIALPWEKCATAHEAFVSNATDAMKTSAPKAKPVSSISLVLASVVLMAAQTMLEFVKELAEAVMIALKH